MDLARLSPSLNIWRAVWIFAVAFFAACGAFAVEAGNQPVANDGRLADWATVLEQRSQWPPKVRLQNASAFDIVLGGVKKGAMTLPKGTLVEIRGVSGEFLQVSAAGLAGSVHYGSTDLVSFIKFPVQEESASTPLPDVRGGEVSSALPPYQVLPFGDIMPDGWIREQMLRDITSGNASYLEKMRPLGAPVTPGSGRGYGEFEGNFADVIIRNAILTGHQPWMERAKGIADFLVGEQDEEGYVGRKRPADFEDLADKEGELWGQCCFLRAFLAYYEFSKEQKYLDAAVRSVDFMISLFGKDKNKYFVGESTMEGGGRAHGLMYIDVLEKLHQLTGDKKYLDFAFRLYGDYSSSINLKNTDHQLSFLLDKSSLFQHHAPHVAEHSRVVYWLSTETEDPKLKEAAANSLSKLNASLSPSGGLVTDDKILEAVGGKPGSPDLRYEYCSITETANSLESAYQKLGDPAVAEMVENTVFNAAQAARFSDGKAAAYCSKDNQSQAVGDPDNASFRLQYAACHRIACCVYNVNRVMPYYVSNMWMKTADGKALLAAFYGPSVLNTKIAGTEVEILQQTLYPFEEEVTMVVKPAQEARFDILLRDPSWSKETRVVADGAEQSRENGFIRLSKQWTKGDTIKIQFAPGLEVKSTHGGESYVKRGALLYALKFDHSSEATKTWEGTDFANYDTRLANKADAGKFSDLKFPAVPGDGNHPFTYSRNPQASARYPFDVPFGFIRVPLLFEGKPADVELVPIGSTVLRKTSFAN